MVTAKKAPANAAPGLAASRDGEHTDTAVEDAPAAAPSKAGVNTAGAASPAYEIVPGADTLGRGIYIRPQQPYELRDYIVKREKGAQQLRPISSQAQSYLVPSDCAVNDSPPLPTGRATGQTIIEESWFRFGREVSTNIHTAANAKVVNIDATSFQGSTLRVEEDAYYALRSSFIPFWNVYLPRVPHTNLVDEFMQLEAEVPTGKLNIPEGPYDPLRRNAYARIFDRFGTHYVTAAWLGGKASLTFVVTKSSNVSKEDLKAGIEATFAGGVASGKTSTERSTAQSRVRNNSTCNVFGSGGDATELAKLTTLQSEQYDKWIGTVKTNPAIIELGVVGIWTLLTDENKSEALRQAYIEESSFSPLTALVPFREWMVMLKGDRAFDYALTSKYGQSRLYTLSCLFKPHEIREPGSLRLKLQALESRLEPGALRNQVESLLSGVHNPMLSAQFVESATGGRLLSEPLPDAPPNAAQSGLQAELASLLNVLLLSGTSVMDQPLLQKEFQNQKERRSWRAQTLDLLEKAATHSVMLNRLLLEELFPKEIARRPSWLTLSSYLPMLEEDPRHAPFDKPHAAFSMSGFSTRSASKLYLFRWRQCLRIDLDTMTVDDGYPRDLDTEWPEVDFDRIDAAVAVAPNRLYFFRGGEYIRYDFDGSDFSLYTRDLIKNRWPGVVFETIDTAAYWGSDKVYFFSGDQYTRYDLAAHRADPGYPKFLSSNYVEDWEIFE